MDLPPPPQDTELRNIIDKLAQFVARNGPDFEQMTKNKQKGNSKFQFLFGGEHYGYYQYKVASEQAIFKQQQLSAANASAPHPIWNTPVPQTQPLANPEIEAITQQQEALQEQIKQSEQNLAAQHAVLLQQQQGQVEVAISKAENDELQLEADNCDLFLEELYNILQPIIDTCTKDSISNGKNWIMQHATNDDRAHCIFHCLLIKVIQGSTFPQKLHVIYLVNDIMHHCVRKNSNEIRGAVEETVVAMFCNASIIATDEQRLKLDKLLRLWETKMKFLGEDILKQIRCPLESYQQYQAEKMAKYAEEIAKLAQQTKHTFDGYQVQHQAYVCHAMQQIMELEQQKQAIEQQSLRLPPISPPPPPSQNNQSSSLISLDSLQQQNLDHVRQSISPDYVNPSNTNMMPPDNFLHSFPPPSMPPQNNSSNGSEHPFTLPPPGFFPPPGVFPDFSKPPPGFAPKLEPPLVEELLPTNPYYDLPAGLIVPLIKLDDSSYKPLDPKDIRLPPPAPPSERLMAALDAFYAPPTHERPRDSEGWEKLGLYEYYKAKNMAKKEKDDMIGCGQRDKSRSPSPCFVPAAKEPSPPRRRYTSKSPTPPLSPPRRRRSPSRSRSRSRSRSPRRRRRSVRSRRRSVSRSPSRSPVRRSSVSPPNHTFTSASYLRELQELDASNKGHQMLRKMGWGGSGLGANEQGIDAPIAGGDVRDRQDQFKGVGCNLNDPYENFRKNKGAAFITRMKARAEERANENKLIDY